MWPSLDLPHFPAIFNGRTWLHSYFVVLVIHQACEPMWPHSSNAHSPSFSYTLTTSSFSFPHISHLENQRNLLHTLRYWGIRPMMEGEGFHFPVHCWDVSNTTWSKVLMGKQLLHSVDQRAVKRTERGILWPGWSTWWPHAIRRKKKEKKKTPGCTMSAFHTVLYIICFWYLTCETCEVIATHRFRPDIVTTLCVDDILLWGGEDGSRLDIFWSLDNQKKSFCLKENFLWRKKTRQVSD